jgi:1-deoxy-D-xylulose-5-phosphate reductoisomerase
MIRVAVLGSTGSVGRSTLEVIAAHPDRLCLAGLAARSRMDVLAHQLAQAATAASPSGRPPLVAVWEEEKAQELSRLTGRSDVAVGREGLIRLATHPEVDIVVVATSGGEALVPLIRAIEAGKRIALASKELLVMAGELIMRLVRERDARLTPIDSEHAALLQCLQGTPPSQVARLIVTGSGGPLWPMSPEERRAATQAQVLAHPKWRMGPKITVDSATLMNKGLEIIEAQWLFGLPLDRLQIVIHPEAVVHALVELVDGTWLAQLSPCDMRLPIQYALSCPERWEAPVPRLTLAQLGGLHFMEPDLAQFPCLRLALEAAAAGGTMCTALNGANDVAVQAYLDGQMAFADIPRLIEDTLTRHTPVAQPRLEDILVADAWSRAVTREQLHQCSAR